MTIEQEFFKTFYDKPRVISLISENKCRHAILTDDESYGVNNNKRESFIVFDKELFKKVCDAPDSIKICIDDIYWNTKKIYYPITPEIVLKMQEFIAQHFEEEGCYKYLGVNSSGYSIYTYLNSKPAISDEYETILDVCLTLQDEPEIQDQVRGLFNEK